MVFMAGRPGITIELPVRLTCPRCGSVATYTPQMDKRCQKCGHRFK